jgi:uncharacterized membrane protein
VEPVRQACQAEANLHVVGAPCRSRLLFTSLVAAVHLTAPMPYTVLVIGLSTLFISPILLLPYGRKAIVAEWRTHWLLIIIAGILMLLSYMLVLQAYSIARVSYAGAIREISVIFAALIGWHWLREDFGAMRTVGAILIFIGILVIAIFG